MPWMPPQATDAAQLTEIVAKGGITKWL
jgi:hypothetical protein